MENKPIRIQRKRTPGFRLQDQSPDGRPVVSVCRPGKWGNPYKVGSYVEPQNDDGISAGHLMTVKEAIGFLKYEIWYNDECIKNANGWFVENWNFTTESIKSELRGKHLACFCPLDQPCHADVLLEIANQD
jgi:ribosomal protein L34